MGLEDIACTHTSVCVAFRVCVQCDQPASCHHAFPAVDRLGPSQTVSQFLLLRCFFGVFYHSNEKVIMTFYELYFIIINTKEKIVYILNQHYLVSGSI